MAVDHSLRPTAGPARFPESLLPVDRLDALLAISGLYLAVLVATYFLRGWQIQLMNLHRPARDARPAPRDLPPPAAHERAVLRPQPRRAPGDPDDDRRRRSERAVHLRRRRRRGRSFDAAVHPRRHALAQPHADAAMVAVGPLVYFAAALFRKAGAHGLSRGARRRRPHQCLSSGAFHRPSRCCNFSTKSRRAWTSSTSSTKSTAAPT